MTGCGIGVLNVMTLCSSSAGRYASAKVFSSRAALGQNPMQGAYQEILVLAGLSEKSAAWVSSQASPENASW
jgi:hypothetical protein